MKIQDRPITREWIDRTQEGIDLEIQLARLHPNLSEKNIKQLKKYRKKLEMMKRFGRLQKGDLYHSQ